MTGEEGNDMCDGVSGGEGRIRMQCSSSKVNDCRSNSIDTIAAEEVGTAIHDMADGCRRPKL